MTRASCRTWWSVVLVLACVSMALGERIVVLKGSEAASRQMSTAPVYVEDSPAAEELVGQARRLYSQGRAAQAVEKYQQLIDQYAGRLMRIDEQRYTDIARWVRGTLLADPKLLLAYRTGHEPIAARALAKAVEFGVDRSKVSAVFERFTLCPSGLEAGLLLAGVCLERGRAADAASVLDELADHPDLSASAGIWHSLQSAAGVFADQPGRVERHRQAVVALGDTAAIEQLETWVAQRRNPKTPRTTSVGASSPVESWPQVPAAPLWQSASMQQDTSRRQLNPYVSIPRSASLSKSSGRLFPVVRGDRMYVNDGMSVAAIDRCSGRTLWWHRSGLKSVQPPRYRPWAQFANGNDLPAVSIDRAMVVAVLGRPLLSERMGRGQVSDTRLVCLDPGDGQVRWQIRPGDLDETLARSFFHGTPIVDHGRIYATVRRAQKSKFQSALIVAVDASSWKFLWRRHLSSAVPIAVVGQPLTRMLYHAGRLYIADYLGSVACLDGRTGSVLWLTTTYDTSKPPGRVNRAAVRKSVVQSLAPTDGPVLVEAGLIVPAVNGDAAWLLSPTTGKKIKELGGPGWIGLGCLMQVGSPGSAVLTVSDAVRLFEGPTLELRWEHRLPGGAAKSRPTGRPAVTLNQVAVPAGNELRLLDLATGKLVRKVPLRVQGNMLVLPDQLIVAGSTVVAGHITWDSASSRIRQRMAASGSGSGEALALAHMALLADRPQVLLEALDAAVAMLPGDSDQQTGTADRDAGSVRTRQRTEVFDFIRNIVDPQSSDDLPSGGKARRRIKEVRADRDLCRGLFDRLAAVAEGELDVAVYRLAMGLFLAGGPKPVDAVVQYQAILADAGLSDQQVVLTSGSRPARLEAKMRLKSLVEEHGLGVYAEYEVMAADRMSQLTAAGGALASAFIDLAEQFPLASTMPRARAAAADALVLRGQVNQAIAQLSRAYVPAGDRQLLAAIVGRLVELYDDAGRPDRARQWLRRVRRERADLQPLRNGQPVSIDRWIDELAQRSRSAGRLPAITLPLGKPYVLTGRLLTPTSQRRASRPMDMIVTRAGTLVQLRAGQSLDVRWQVPLDSADVGLLSLTDEQVLLYSARSAVLWALDTQSGQVLWRSDELDVAVSRIVADAARVPEQLGLEKILVPAEAVIRLQRPGGTGSRGLTVAAGEMVVCVVDSRGRALALDRHSGNMLWQYHCGLAGLAGVVVDDDIVAIGGSMGSTGEVFVLDALTGRLRMPPVEEQQPIAWLGLADVGVLTYATKSHAVAVDLADGDLLWRLTTGGLPLSGIAAAGDGYVLLHDIGGSLMLLDAAAGRLGHQSKLAETAHSGRAASARSQWPQLQLTDGQWHLLTPRRAQAWRYDGRLLWRDAVGTLGRALLVQLVADPVVALVALADTIEPEAAEGVQPTYRLFVLDRKGGAIRAEYALPDAGRPLDTSSSACLDHRFVLSAGDTTIVVPDAVAGKP